MNDKTEYAKRDIKEFQNYIIIFIVQLFAVFFLPMVGTSVNLEWKLPTTFAGWMVYVITKVLVAAINIILFHSFMEQAKINVRSNPNYIEANTILLNVTNKKEYKPRSPREWNKKEYGVKGFSIVVSSILSAVGLTQAVLTFDWIQMLTYIFTITMGIIFGVIQMNHAEAYWTGEYLKYAKMVEKDNKAMEMVTEESIEQGDADIHDLGGDSVLVSSNSNGGNSAV